MLIWVVSLLPCVLKQCFCLKIDVFFAFGLGVLILQAFERKTLSCEQETEKHFDDINLRALVQKNSLDT